MAYFCRRKEMHSKLSMKVTDNPSGNQNNLLEQKAIRASAGMAVNRGQHVQQAERTLVCGRGRNCYRAAVKCGVLHRFPLVTL